MSMNSCCSIVKSGQRTGEVCGNPLFEFSDYCVFHTSRDRIPIQFFCKHPTKKGGMCKLRVFNPGNFCHKHSSKHEQFNFSNFEN